MPKRKVLEDWVEQVARHTEPDKVVWCDGSEAENTAMVEDMLDDRSLIRLNHKDFPGCYLHRSHPNDVARTEKLTFICSKEHHDAGPTNNWMSPKDAQARVWPIFRKAMKGRTMFVVPYLMGPEGSAFASAGVEITDSRYVVVAMRIMCRIGTPALAHIGRTGEFVRGLHSLADLSPERRFILHFPERDEIWSVGSGYGGNALLGKKCHALRIASGDARKQGWLAEHMLIVGIESPEGKVTYIAAAFPSACGKTNLAMLQPPAEMKGWKVWTVGDDIAWMRWGPDGRLYAVNPETGFFGVVPATSMKTNPNAMATIRKNTIFANVAMTHDGHPWWEGMDGAPPAEAWDWKGHPWTPGSEDKAAHPNSRYATPAAQCPCISPHWQDPQGVPISAIIFGGRRAHVAPLVYEAFNWQHGVYVGAGMATETTAAQTGAVGVVRRDPMAMLPFCAYNMAHYFRHWLDMGARPGVKPPGIFHVNWFRTDSSGAFLWPGFGQNLRVLKWIAERCAGGGDAIETPIGLIPSRGSIELSGLSLTQGGMNDLMTVDPEDWMPELEEQEALFGLFGKDTPPELVSELAAQRARLGRISSAG
jgi:phosphoenolpyruvate carboxykinase (GTP)